MANRTVPPHILPMTGYSLLDLVPVTQGGSVAQSLANAADLARHAEREGFGRYWVAEHHGMPGIASAATAVVIAHVGAATSTIRVGAGGTAASREAAPAPGAVERGIGDRVRGEIVDGPVDGEDPERTRRGGVELAQAGVLAACAAAR